VPEDQDLGERDSEHNDDFPPSDRVIHTQGYDLSINTLQEQWDDGTLVIPDFQREYVWDNPKASRLIESLLLNIPIPVLYFAETDQAQYEIVDGHQRVFSVVRYLNNQFALSGLHISNEFKGKRFHQLPEREQRFLRTRSMRAIVIAADSSPTMKFEVFERLNTGGLALNAQEIRNAIYGGTFNNLLKELETHKVFRGALGLSRVRKRMVDRELVLRFLAMHDELATYRTPLVRFLNDYMREHRSAGSAWISRRRDLLIATASTAAAVYPNGAFRVTNLNGDPTEKSVNRALYDAQMLVFASISTPAAADAAPEVRRQIGKLFLDDDFQNTIRRATGDKTRLRDRVLALIAALEASGVEVRPSLAKSARKMAQAS